MFAFFWKRSHPWIPPKIIWGTVYTLYAEIDCFGNFGPGSIAWDHDERLWWSSRTRLKASVDSQASGLDIQKHMAVFKASHITPPCCLSIFFELTALLRQIQLSLSFVFVFEYDELIIVNSNWNHVSPLHLRCRGPVSDFWAQFMDPGDTGAMSRTEWGMPSRCWVFFGIWCMDDAFCSWVPCEMSGFWTTCPRF